MASTLTFRELPPAEWPRLLDDGIEPFATVGLPDAQHAVILVAEDEGRILGASLLLESVLNHWGIAPEAQRSPAMISGLWEATRQALDERGVRVIHTTVSDAQVDVQAMVERLGYVPAEGSLYVMQVDACVLNGR